MKRKAKGYEFKEYTARQAQKDNVDWFSSLSPGQKIRAIEEGIKTHRYLQSLRRSAPKHGT